MPGGRSDSGDVDNPKLCLWFAYPAGTLTEPQLEACRSLLTPEERERMARLRSDSLRRECLATRVLVRTALSLRQLQPAASWRFRNNPWGKPEAWTKGGMTS